MEIVNTELKGVFFVKNFIYEDNRGVFCKVYNNKAFKKKGLCYKFEESFYSVSAKNVIRGMHFQIPPFDHDKLVYVPKGKIIDVILDLRTTSKTYGDFISVELSEENRNSIYIPAGFAHGFKSLKDNTIAVYNVSTIYNPNYNSGIKWNSFGMKWNTDDPIISDRDNSLLDFNDFTSPF